MKKIIIKLIFISLSALVSCNNEVDNHYNKAIDIEIDNIKAILGHWHPISYSGSRGQSLTKSDVDTIMQQTIYFGENTVKIFDDFEINNVHYSIDTIADLKYYLRMNLMDIDIYEMFPTKCLLIIINGYTHLKEGKQIEVDTDFLYNGEYLLVNYEGVSFLCKKNISYQDYF